MGKQKTKNFDPYLLHPPPLYKLKLILFFYIPWHSVKMKKTEKVNNISSGKK